jgi:hypothetical protein
MKLLLATTPCMGFAFHLPVGSWERDNNDYIRGYQSPFSKSNVIEVRDRLNPDSSRIYRGTVDRDGSIRLRNFQGDVLRGNIDQNGYASQTRST